MTKSVSHKEESRRLLLVLGLMLMVFVSLYVRLEFRHHYSINTIVSQHPFHISLFGKEEKEKFPVPITLWSSDFHISPIADIKSIVTKWGVKIIDKSLSSHCHLTSTCAKDLRVINQQNGISLPCPNYLRRVFYEVYRNDDELRSADAFICTHADSMCELFMPFDRPLIVIASTRYEIGRLTATAWNRWNHNLQKIAAKSEWNSVGANNQYDRTYMQYFTNLTDQQLLYIPNLCQYVTARYHHPATRWDVLLAPYRGINTFLERKLLETLHSFSEHQEDIMATNNLNVSANSLLGRRIPLSIRKISDLYPKRYEYSDLASHSAVVILPYQVSLMSFFEFYHMNIPIFVPSASLLTKWHMQLHVLYERTWMSAFDMPEHNSIIPRHINSTCPLFSDPNDEFTAGAVEEWVQLSDYYTWPHVTTFNSFEDLFAKLWQTDLQEISQRMAQYNVELQEKVEQEWFRILTKVADAKIQRLKREKEWQIIKNEKEKEIQANKSESNSTHLRGLPTASASVIDTPIVVVPPQPKENLDLGDNAGGDVGGDLRGEGQPDDYLSPEFSPQMSLDGAFMYQIPSSLIEGGEIEADVDDSDPTRLPFDINKALRRSYGISLVDQNCDEQIDVDNA